MAGKIGLLQGTLFCSLVGQLKLTFSRTMASISGMLPDDCSVLRDGHRVDANAVDLVPGDILYIKFGNKLPADVRFIEVSSDAKFDRSILTGESQPVPGSIEYTDKNYLETNNIGMQGTHCISGTTIGITVSTGDSTVFGKIARLTSTPKTGMTPLQKEILRFIIIICSLMIFFNIVVIICWGAWLRKSHPNWINTAGLIVDVVTVAVAFIPEGLPIALTASSDDHCEHYEEQSSPVQISQDSRNTGRCFCHFALIRLEH